MTGLKYLDEVLKDVRTELGEPEVSELITPRLDDKLEVAIALVEGLLDHGED